MRHRRQLVSRMVLAAAEVAAVVVLGAASAPAEDLGFPPRAGGLRIAAPAWTAEVEAAFSGALAEFEQSSGVEVEVARLSGRGAGGAHPDIGRAKADALRRLAGAFDESRGTRENHDRRGLQDPIAPEVLAMLAGEGAPDILWVDASEVAGLAAAGRILPLENITARRSGTVIRVPNAALETCRHHGRVYGMPVCLAGADSQAACVVSAKADRELAFELLLHLAGRFPAEPSAPRAQALGAGVSRASESPVMRLGVPGKTAAGARFTRAVAWEPMVSGSASHLYAVFGTSAGNVYAAGDAGTILRFDGAAWSAVKSPASQPLLDIFGRASNDIYAAGCKGTILHFDGSNWSAMASGTTADLYGIWGDASCLYAVGALSSTQGIILRYTTMGWVPQNAGAIAPLSCVFGTSSTDVWAGGGGLYHYDGSQWYTVFGAGGTYGIWGSSAGGVYTAGDAGWVTHCFGTSAQHTNISIEGRSDTLQAIWGSSCADIFAVGCNGSAYHYDGASWFLMNTGTSATLRDVWGSSGSNVFAVGPSGLILRYDGSPFAPVLPKYSQTLSGIFAPSPSDVWVVGTAGSTESIMYHYDGSNWSVMKCPAGAKSLACAFGAAGGPVWFAGGGVYWYNSGQWGTKFGAGGIYGLWGSSADNVFGVGDSGNIARFGLKHESWMKTPASELLASVWGSAANNVFAAGRDGTILHYNGNSSETWTLMPSGTKASLEGIWGSAGNNVFAVGRMGTILRFDGSKWSAISSGTAENIYAVWGASATDVFAAGGGGTILRFDGKAWAPMQSPTTQPLLALRGTGPNNIYAAGCDATILRFDGSKWMIVQSGSSLPPSFFLSD